MGVEWRSEMEITRDLETFFARREHLLDELTHGAQNVTAWYEQRRATDPTLHDLAMLEGMLAERKKLLEQLTKLDDDMLVQLIKARGEQR